MTLFHYVYYVYVFLGYTMLSERCGSLLMVVPWLFVIGLLSWDEPGVTLACRERKSNIYNH